MTKEQLKSDDQQLVNIRKIKKMFAWCLLAPLLAVLAFVLSPIWIIYELLSLFNWAIEEVCRD